MKLIKANQQIPGLFSSYISGGYEINQSRQTEENKRKKLKICEVDQLLTCLLNSARPIKNHDFLFN